MHSFTLEASFYGYNKDGSKEFGQKDYLDMGKFLGIALLAFVITPPDGLETHEQVFERVHEFK